MSMRVQEEGQLLMEIRESAFMTTQVNKTNQSNKRSKGKASLDTNIKKRKPSVASVEQRGT